MIVETMTHSEAIEEIRRDTQNVAHWWKHRVKELYRAALKRTQFPWVKWYEYQSPRNNRYMVVSRCNGRNYRKTGARSCIALRKARKGYEVYSVPMMEGSQVTPTVLLPHLFERYAERTGMDPQTPTIDVIKRFFDRNSNGSVSRDEKLMPRSVRYNGKEHVAVCVKEGVMLGQMESDLFMVVTFITYDMTNGMQEEDFLRRQQKVLTEVEMVRALKQKSETFLKV